MGGFSQQTPTDERSGLLPTIGVGVLIVVIVVAAFTFLSRGEHKGPTPPPAYSSKLVLSDLKLSAAENFVGGTVTYLDGKITNNGDKTVTRVIVEANFKNSLGQVVQRETLPIRVLKTTGPYPDVVDLSQAPLAPNQTRPFRLTVEGTLSADWNREYPELKVTQITLK